MCVFFLLLLLSFFKRGFSWLRFICLPCCHGDQSKARIVSLWPNSSLFFPISKHPPHSPPSVFVCNDAGGLRETNVDTCRTNSLAHLSRGRLARGDTYILMCDPGAFDVALSPSRRRSPGGCHIPCWCNTTEQPKLPLENPARLGLTLTSIIWEKPLE